MSKATDDQFDSLHGMVAKVLAKQLADTGVDEATGDEVFTASPATIAQAIKFLKDNSVTRVIAESDSMSALEENLKRRKRSGSAKLASVTDIMESNNG